MERNRTPSPYLDVPGFLDTDALDIDDLLSGTGDIELEIGFGRGRFLLDRASANPSHRFLGVETRRKWVHVVAERAKQRQIVNVTVRSADIRQVLPRLTPDQSIQRVFINFPDPWWKKRHLKRMVITPELTAQITRLLRPGGELFIQTDVDFRAQAYLKTVSETDGLIPSHNGNGAIEHNPFGARSLREIHCEKLGLPIHRLLFHKP